jgi:hypothetical protein
LHSTWTVKWDSPDFRQTRRIEQMSTMRASTLRRSLITGAALAAASFAGQTPASTMEEVIAHGTTAVVAAQQAQFEADMAAYVHSVQSELKNSVREHLEQAGAPKLRLALTTVSNRG